MFKADSTGMSFYNQFFTKPEYMAKAKGLQAKVVIIDPDIYMVECSKIHNVPLEHEFRAIDKENLEHLTKLVMQGVLMDMPVLDYAGRTQEGRHRVLIAKELGVNQIPVLIVTKTG